MDKRLFDEKAACEYLSIGRSKFYQLVKRGLIPRIRVDSAPRYPREDLDRFVDKLKAAQANGQH